jgi:ribosome modulation factor
MKKVQVKALGEDLQAIEDAKKAGMRTGVAVRSGDVTDQMDVQKRNQKILEAYEKFKKSLKTKIGSEDLLARAFLKGFKEAYMEDSLDI